VIAAVIVAGGSGERLGLPGGKQLARVAGLPVLAHTLRAFDACEDVDAAIIVTHPERVDEYHAEVVGPASRKVLAVVAGGDTRQASVACGLRAVPPDADIIVVHDGARPLVTPEVVSAAIRALLADPGLDGVVVGHPSYDTLKIVDGDARVVGTADRRAFWSAQTPQVFRADVLRGAYERAESLGIEGTDDAAIVEAAGGRVAMLRGPRDNVKVTVPEDLRFVERALAGERSANMAATRIGLGYDVHAFAEGRALVLGGVEIPYDRGLAGHSDADVLVHAVMDAIVGALREGDIGRLFPDSDPAYSGISSIELLRRVAALTAERGYRLVDLDAVLVLEAPRIAPYRERMRAMLADALGVSPDQVGVKATTTEGLGFEGRGEGVAAHAVVLLERTGT
jgi:2-C-methyl-D-erythritol 4-phosphate cytidylyltransferase/2-C-methyl-D-erythritol 2,4-cyclodiphosphate synthase